ncbi:DHH family phosphoesterase [Helcococcus kunzii]|uniref:DHH family phosphoesterase n=1 Tax=Helcococcus kunzii TaxID=40091 RepID=UPI001BAE65D4|nr:DHH family phosphoesterase [Helcococcus kunzii]MCT1796269.1 DHH family phosphoesterase [Helcococcus kunzii]MCT1989127.1 DHH family phosphoesterase [Helcococcus kunzii]QUY64203.1 DHH family phosphoesterase [Helcococcus kunzii]
MLNKFINKDNISDWIAPIAVLILTVILLALNIYLGIVGILLFTITAYNAYDVYTKKQEEFKDYIDTLDIAFEGFTKNAVFNMPFPIVVLNKDSQLSWYNSKFKEMVKEKNSLIDKKIYNVIPEIEEEALFNEEQKFTLQYALRTYEVHINETSEDLKSPMKMLYFVDITEQERVFSNYENEKLVIMNIRIDNFEEINTNTPSERRPLVLAEIDSIITSYFHKYGSLIIKNENSRYFAALYKTTLDEMLEDKFSFVERVRNVSLGNTLAPTLSIGTGYNEDSPRQNEKSANGALDIALGRGGDQIVLKTGDEIFYYGGKNQATEKRTKVRARVIAHALSQLISKSDKVIISGHKNPDMDSFGSTLGLWYAAKTQSKKAYIVLSEVTPAIENLYHYAVKSIEDLEDSIITPDEAFDLADHSSLFIVTDNHRANSVEEPRIFEKTDTVVVIDHHRRGNDYIENAILNYVEPYASSASELVTEMLMYMNEKVEINKVVAEGLLSGIITDTKRFNQQTGIRTFEAAVVLKQHGADTSIVNSLFSEDLETIRNKSEIIANSEIYDGKYIFGYFNHDIDESTLIASQAADELASIQNMLASFVFTLSKGKVHISARSKGDVSVQLIMEKLNGGGHRTVAATQLDVSLDEAKELLKKAIKEYSEEE